MPQHIQLPDGSVAEFPDGMPETDIEAALAGHEAAVGGGASVRAAPPQMTGFARPFALTATNALEGVERMLGTPGDIGSAALHLLPSGVQDVVHTGQHYGLLPSFPTSEDLLAPTRALGLTQRSDLIPGWGEGGDSERVLAAAARGYGSAIPATVLGPAEAAVPTLLSGTGGGVGEELWRTAHPDNKLGALIAGFLGGTAAGNAANAGTRLLRSAAGRFGPEGAEFVAVGLPLRSATLTGGRPSTRNLLGQFAPKEATHSDIQNSIAELANSLGQSTTLQKAGTHLQGEAQDWLKTTMPAKEDLAWRPVDAAIPANTATGIGNFEGVLKSLTQKGGSLASVVNLLQPRLPAQILKTLNARGQLASLLNGSTTPTWAEVRALRSAIGRAMSEPSIAPKAGALNLQAMYAGITQDLSRVAKAYGAGDLFAAANAESTRLHGFAENLLSNVVGNKAGRGNPNPEDAAHYFLNAADLKRGGSDLKLLQSELPQSTRELAAAHLHGIANPSGANPPTVGKNLLNIWDKMSPEAKAALLPPSGLRRMDALAGVSRRLLALPAPRSGSTAHAGTGLGIGAALSAAGAGINHLLGGGHLDPMTFIEMAGGASTLGAVAGGTKNRVLNTLANSPAVARYAASLPPGWVLPPSVSAGLGAEVGEEGGNGLEQGR